MGTPHSFMDDATATLEGYNTELQRCLDELRAKKSKIVSDMENEKQARGRHEDELRQLTEKLSRINDSLGRKVSARNGTTLPSRRPKLPTSRFWRALRPWIT